jgi:hypothetical protein
MEMDRFVTSQNIERYRALASGFLTESERRMVLQLLAEENAKWYGLCTVSKNEP